MDGSNVRKLHLVAGTVRAECACCAARQALVTQPGLDASRRVCPGTGRMYADRGDGLYEPEDAESPLLSDRPRRTEAKTRIDLERATFAARREGA